MIYELELKTGETIVVDNPSKLPDVSAVADFREPIVTATILVPQEHLGNVITLCIEKRGVQRDMQFLGSQVQVRYDMPMNEVVLDFFDRLKSTSRGYASLDYHFDRYQSANLVKLDVLINGDKVDALALIVHRDNAAYKGRALTEKMKELILGRCSTWRSRQPLAARSSRGRPSRRSERTYWPSATVVTSAVRRNCWRSRRPVRNA